jgi:hypothetical protein
VRSWTPRAVALLGFALYAILAPAGPTWLDSGELGAAAWQLGSPHPTGFPLHGALARALSLVPVGELAYRLHLASAVAAALAMYWLVLLVAQVGRHEPAAWIGGAAGALLLGAALTFARQATVTEVYAPTAAVLCGTLYLYDRVARGADARVGLCLALVAGLGIGAHASFRMLVPLPLAALLFIRLRRGARWPLLAPLIAIGAGAAIHMMLPVRSATGRTAAVDWGHPSRAGELFDHVTAQEIRDSFAGEMMAAEPLVVVDSAARFLGGVGDQVGALGLFAALAGALFLVRDRRSRWLFAALAVVGAGDAFYAIWLNPMGIDDGQVGVPLLVAIGALAGVGIAWLGRFSGRAGPFSAAAAGALVLVPAVLVSLPALAPPADARRYAESALEAAPPRAILLSQSDSLSAGLLFLQVVEGARPDVSALVRQRLGDRDRTEAVLGAPLDLAGILAGDRPVVWELGDDAAPDGLRPAGVVGVIDGDAGTSGEEIRRAAGQLEGLFGDDAIAIRTEAQAMTGLGRLAYQHGEVGLAMALFDRALAGRPHHAEALVNRGVVLSRLGRVADAAEVTERALEVEPNRVRALLNAARYRLVLGERARALAHAERALRLDPDSADAWFLAGAAGDSAERLRRAVELGHPEAAAALRALPAER